MKYNPLFSRLCKAIILGLMLFGLLIPMNAQKNPLRIGVAGVSHAHLHEVIIRLDRGDFQIVGVSESDPRILKENGLRGKVADSLFFADIEEMLERKERQVLQGNLSSFVAAKDLLDTYFAEIMKR